MLMTFIPCSSIYYMRKCYNHERKPVVLFKKIFKILPNNSLFINMNKNVLLNIFNTDFSWDVIDKLYIDSISYINLILRQSKYFILNKISLHIPEMHIYGSCIDEKYLIQFIRKY